MKLGVRTETDYNGRPAAVVFDTRPARPCGVRAERLYVRFRPCGDRVTTVTVTFYPVNEHGQICGPTAEQRTVMKPGPTFTFYYRDDWPCWLY